MFKKVVALMLVVFMCVSIAACSNNETEDSSKGTEKKDMKIGLAMAGMSSAYLIPVAEYAKLEAEKNGAELILMDAQWDAQKQADQIANLMAQKVDAIILCPVDAKSLLPSLKKIDAAGIPLINLNMKVDDVSTDYIDTYVGASMTEEAELAAELMIDALGEEGGEIVIIEGAPGSDAQIFRTKAFVDVISQHENIKIVGMANGGWDRAKAMAAAEDLMTKYPNLKGIYTHDDNMTVGAVEAAKAAGKDKNLVFIGIGGSINGLEAIKSGEMYGSVTQPPDWEGAQSVRCAIMAINGEQLKAWYRDPVEKITSENVDEFKGLW